MLIPFNFDWTFFKLPRNPHPFQRAQRFVSASIARASDRSRSKLLPLRNSAIGFHRLTTNWGAQHWATGATRATLPRSFCEPSANLPQTLRKICRTFCSSWPVAGNCSSCKCCACCVQQHFSASNRFPMLFRAHTSCKSSHETTRDTATCLSPYHPQKRRSCVSIHILCANMCIYIYIYIYVAENLRQETNPASAGRHVSHRFASKSTGHYRARKDPLPHIGS